MTSTDELSNQLLEGIERFQKSDQFQSYLRMLTKFPTYSFNNTVLIWMQKPDASFVAGFYTWRHQFNRTVRKGEKGIRIYAPLIHKSEDDEQIVGYRAIHVFDVSQTVGDPLPLIQPQILEGDDIPLAFFKALCTISPVPVRYDFIENNALGYFNPTLQEIVLKPGYSPQQTVKTLAHEIAHAMMHTHSDLSIPIKEMQAESVAYMVMSHFGLDTSSYSFPYIATWCQHEKMDTLRAALTQVSITANQMIVQLEKVLKPSLTPAIVPAQLPQRSRDSQILPA